MKAWNICSVWLFVIMLLFTTTSAQAGVVINGTRVIYPSDKQEVTVRLTNEGDIPALVQSWLDEGNPDAAPESIKVPFMLTPPIARIDPQKSQVMRLISTHGALPMDRESLFWLNVLEVPPKTVQADDVNHLKLAFRTRIKVIYRPSKLEGDVSQASSKLTWTLVTSEDGKGTSLHVTNPTPYYISFNDVSLRVEDRNYKTSADMVKPQGQATFNVEDMTALPKGTVQVDFSTINDYGKSVNGSNVASVASSK